MSGTRRRMMRAVLTRIVGAPTALVVPVEGVPLPPAGQPGLPHHVTVVYPFVRSHLLTKRIDSRLRAAFGSVSRFDVRLTAVGRFPDVVYLTPEPAQPFLELISACVAAVPSHPPYRGAFDAIVPHVTVLQNMPEPEEFEQQLAAALPLPAHADAVALFVLDRTGRWHPHRRYPLGEVDGD